MTAPLIAITADVDGERQFLRHGYAERVVRAGGVPVIVGPADDERHRAAQACVDRFDGFILSGGDDPDTTWWGESVHPAATLIDPRRQAFEVALLEALEEHPDKPVLGVCLGAQMMALHTGGRIDQHLPDHLDTASEHWGRRLHPVTGVLGSGDVLSHHRQAIADPGPLEIVGRAPDGVIEAVRHPDRGWFVGVQWHPERTDDPRLGAGIFEGLVSATALVV